MAVEGKFTRGPEIVVDIDYKGVTGRVHLTFTDGEYCSVRCEGWLNVPDSDRVRYRGKEYLPHIRVRRLSADDELIVWGIDPNDWQSLDAPPTYKAAIIAAIVDAVQTHGTQDVINAATYAHALTDLYHADNEARELMSKLSAVRGEQVRLRGLVTRYSNRPRYNGEN